MMAAGKTLVMVLVTEVESLRMKSLNLSLVEQMSLRNL